MTKKEYCLNNPISAVYTGGLPIAVHGINYDIYDYLHCSYDINGKNPTYHKLMIYCDKKEPYVKFYNIIIKMYEFMKVGI